MTTTIEKEYVPDSLPENCFVVKVDGVSPSREHYLGWGQAVCEYKYEQADSRSRYVVNVTSAPPGAKAEMLIPLPMHFRQMDWNKLVFFLEEHENNWEAMFVSSEIRKNFVK